MCLPSQSQTVFLWPVVAFGYGVPAVARSVSAVVALGYDVPAVARSVPVRRYTWPHSSVFLTPSELTVSHNMLKLYSKLYGTAAHSVAMSVTAAHSVAMSVKQLH